MHTSTTEVSPRAVKEPYSRLDIVPLQDANATPASSSNHASITDAMTATPNNCVIIIQNNYIAEGGTINIFSGHCTSSTVVKLNHEVAPTTEPTILQPPLAMQPVAVEHGRDNIVLSGNTFGECVMINIGSPNCTGAIKQTTLASQINHSI